MAEEANNETPGAGSGSTTVTTSGSEGDAGAAAAAAAAAGGGGGADGDPWYAGLPADLVKDRNVNKYESAEAMARAHLNAIKRYGVPADRLLEVPEKPDDKEGWGKLYKALGRPDKPEDYGVSAMEGASEADTAMIKSFTETAHGLGASKAVVGAAIEALNGARVAEGERLTKEREAETAATTAALKTEWGDKHQQYVNEIGKLVLDNGGEELVEELNRLGLGNSVGLNKLLAKLIDERAEPGSLPGANAGDVGGAQTPYQAQALLAKFNEDKDKQEALLDPQHLQHKAVLDERRALHQAAYPNDKAAGASDRSR